MATTRINADSLLAIDVGSVTTRVMLFDDVEGRYRFIASGSAPTSVYAPYKDVAEGLRRAIERLQEITGRVLVGADERLIIPSRPDGAGVDQVVATLSAGPPLRVVVLGLLEDVSLDSARHLATTTYARILENIGLNDRRKTAERIDTILRLRPDLVIAAGGTEGGASQSVLNLLESVGLANYILPEDQRFDLLFVGNQGVKDEISATFGKFTPLHFAPNVRPDLEIEQIEPAQVRLADLARHIRVARMQGIAELDSWAGGGLLPTATAFGRVVRFLSKIYNPEKGVLGIDLGASATTLAVACDGRLQLGVFPQYGLGRALAELSEHIQISTIARWLHLPIPENYVREYLLNKSLYPGSLPASEEDLALEQAIARQLIQLALGEMARYTPLSNGRSRNGGLPTHEPIVASGSVVTRAPNHAQSMLTLLDGLQPVGVTTLVLDQNHLMPALGAAQAVNPILAAQVLETGTFLNMGTVISPIGTARPGVPVLRVRMKQDGGGETSLDVKAGTIEVLHLPLGKPAQLQLQPLHRFDIGMGGPGRGGSLRVVGGSLGVVIDARGRPLVLPADPGQRRDLIAKWRWMLGC